MLKNRHPQRFYALKNISFHVARGEGLAVVGHNGAGKSTLLGLVAGLAQPDTGRVAVNGRVVALLELGSGFHPDLTGAENVPSTRVDRLGPAVARRKCSIRIVDFSGIVEFIDEPLRTYSAA